MFGEGRLVPLDRNAKVRIQTLARALMRRTEPGKHYGVLTAKFVMVLDALLWSFHNAASGRCFPSYERIAGKADCDRSTVYNAINALERAGILTWVHRIKRIREWGADLFGKARNRERVVRTSNQYAFVDPKASEFEVLNWNTEPSFSSFYAAHTEADHGPLRPPPCGPSALGDSPGGQPSPHLAAPPQDVRG